MKLVKPKKLSDWHDIAAASRMRAAEIRDGVLVGFVGSGAVRHLPPVLKKAIDELKEIAEHFDEAAERVQGARRDEDELPIDGHRQLLVAGTRDVEHLLTAFMKAAMEFRKLGIAAASEIDDRIPKQ